MRSNIAPVAGVALALLVTVPAALGGGEPKNEQPFIRATPVAGTRATASVLTGQIVSGEPKNEYPFTRSVSPRP